MFITKQKMKKMMVWMKIGLISAVIIAGSAAMSQTIGGISSSSLPTVEKCILRFDPSKVLLARLTMKNFPCSDRLSSATLNLIGQVIQKLSTPPATGTKWRFANTEVNSINQLLNSCQESAISTQMQTILSLQPSTCTINLNDTGAQDTPGSSSSSILPSIGN